MGLVIVHVILLWHFFIFGVFVALGAFSVHGSWLVIFTTVM